MQEPSVFYVPADIPPDIERRLSERFGIRPGDAILRFHGQCPPYTLQRDFDGASAGELGAIISRLTRERGRGRSPARSFLRLRAE